MRETIGQHISIHHDREVGGVLVGESSGLKLTVRAVIPAFSAPAPSEPVTVSPSAWAAVTRELERHPQQRIVGWYRSRVAGGPLPSANDRGIQRRYFRSPEQVALIVEADSGRETWFGWDRDELTRLGAFHAPRRGVKASTRRRSLVTSLWSQRAACALAGVALGSAGWLTLIRSASTNARPANAPAAHAGKPVAHPIVVEPQAGVQSALGNTGR